MLRLICMLLGSDLPIQLLLKWLSIADQVHMTKYIVFYA